MMKRFAALFAIQLLLSFPALAKDKCNILHVNKDRITDDDVLEISITRCPDNPANELSMISPDGRYFFIANNPFSKENPPWELFTREQFSLIKSLQIKIKDFKVRPFQHGVREPETVFSKKGYYKFYLAPDLGAGDAYPFMKKVYYSP